MKNFSILSSLTIVSIFLLFHNGYAEKQPPALVEAVKVDPYYFADGGLGINILKLFQQPLTPYLTFANFEPQFTNTGKTTPFQIKSTGFTLTDLPSLDKEPFYNLVSMYINPGIKPNPFDIKVDILTGDNSTLQTWSFQKCSVMSYFPFLNQNVIQYKFHMKWQAEIQDISTFSCSGLNLKS